MRSSTFQTKSLHSRNSHVGHSTFIIHGRCKFDMSDLTDSNVDLSMFSFERDLVRYMKRSTFEVVPSDKSLSIFTCVSRVVEEVSSLIRATTGHFLNNALLINNFLFRR